LELCSQGNVRHHVHHFGPFQQQQWSLLIPSFVGCLQYIHGSGFVHADLKPANLLLQTRADESLVLKIADFGSTKEIRGVEMLTCRGTKEYAAPELLLGLIWNERVDIWACGLCSYYMLTGRIPFDVLEPTVVQTFRNGSLPEMCWHGLPDSIVRFLLKCLTVKVEDRPSAKELELGMDSVVRDITDIPHQN